MIIFLFFVECFVGNSQNLLIHNHNYILSMYLTLRVGSMNAQKLTDSSGRIDHKISCFEGHLN